MTTSTTAIKQQDKFSSSEYSDGKQTVPYIQMLNSSRQAGAYGFFIPTKCAEQVGFVPCKPWDSHTQTFRTGNVVEGYKSIYANILILHSSRLMMYNRGGKKKFIGFYDKDVYSKDTMLLKRRFMIYLVDENNQLMHNSPLQFTTSGSFSGSFGEALQDFQNRMDDVYSSIHSTDQRRGDRFMSMAVFKVKVEPFLKGDVDKSWVCNASEYTIPTPTTWQKLFVGYDETTANHVSNDFDRLNYSAQDFDADEF
jgi:hypothetical protein